MHQNSSSFPVPLVTASWLANNINIENISVVDGSWHLPSLNRDPKQEFLEKHIPRSVFFDIDKIADLTNPLPHMIPSEKYFADQVEALGISSDSHVIAYDSTGFGSAARVWWMFRLFGHEHISVLNGGLPAWEAAEEKVSVGMESPRKGTFSATLNSELLRNLDQMREIVKTQQAQILDARSRGRFDGTEAEPRGGLESGCMPGSFNLPFIELYDAETKLILSADRLSKLLAETGIDAQKSIVTSCGSGITACNLALALYLTGNSSVAVYDGSWTEWGGQEDTPISR